MCLERVKQLSVPDVPLSFVQGVATMHPMTGGSLLDNLHVQPLPSFCVHTKRLRRYQDIILSLHKATRRLVLLIMKEFWYVEKEKGSFVYKVYLTCISSSTLDVIHDSDLKSVSMGYSIFNLRKQSTSDAGGKTRFIRSR